MRYIHYMRQIRVYACEKVRLLLISHAGIGPASFVDKLLDRLRDTP